MDYVMAAMSCLVTIVFAYVVVVGMLWAIVPPEVLHPNLFVMLFDPPVPSAAAR